MQRQLIVYFSRTGYTRKVAEKLAARCGADFEAVQDVRARSGIWGYFRSAREALKETLIEIRPPTKNPSDYELVILGTPVWGSHACSPMRAYLTSNRDKFRNVAFLCTEGGSGAEKVFREMGDLCGRTPAASEVFTDGEIKGSRYKGKLDGFARALALPKAA